ncbi:MAG: thiamine-phosphate kinase [Bacteroidales bacterium]|nr:thiamine-phosphate kinase [Bacteroidales bacterium]
MLENPGPKRTELSELGEFGLISHLTSGIDIINPSTIKGIGDDAAVLDNGNKLTLVSTDLLVEGVHFDLAYTPLKHLGYKAAAVNFSDIAAMNGIPTQLYIGLSVSNRFPLEALEELYEGIKLACAKYKVDLAGGDTTSSKSGLILAMTVTGVVEKENVVYRNTAKENELICVSGDLGSAYLGLLLLEREKQVFMADPNMQPDLEGNDYILERQLKPEPRMDIIRKLAEAGIKPGSMIDISDGLASEILHICNDSGVGCRIYEEKIPIDVSTATMATEFNIQPVTAAMNGGEDYELLFTIPMSDLDKINQFKDISVIGHITDAASGCGLVSHDGVLIEITAQGFNHMTS